MLSPTLALLVVPQGTAASGLPARQASASQVNEKKLGKNIAALVEAVRQRNGLRKLPIIHDSKLRADACESAKGHKKGYGMSRDVRTGVVIYPFDRVDDVGNLSTFSYTTSNPGQLPDELQVWTTKPTYDAEAMHRLGVGVCFVRTSQNPEGIYGIDVGYYMGAVKTFLYRVTFMWD
jgi:hypothetical protein